MNKGLTKDQRSEYARWMNSQRKVHRGGFNDPGIARKAALKGQESRREKKAVMKGRDAPSNSR